MSRTGETGFLKCHATLPFSKYRLLIEEMRDDHCRQRPAINHVTVQRPWNVHSVLTVGLGAALLVRLP